MPTSQETRGYADTGAQRTTPNGSVPFDMSQFESIFSGLKGVGTDTKAKSKADKDLAKLQGKLQQQLAEQEAQYRQQLSAQEIAARLQLQQQQQGYEAPFRQADLTGFYNGQATLARQGMTQDWEQFLQQLDEQRRQFNIGTDLDIRELGERVRQFDVTTEQGQRQFEASLQQDQETLGLRREIERGQLNLAQLTQDQQNAIANGNLDLARQIETKKVQLQEQQQAAQIQLERNAQAGYLESGDLTEAARAARAQEALARSQAMGYDPSGSLTLQGRQQTLDEAFRRAQLSGTLENGQLTDASQEWRTGAGLQAAGMIAQAQMRPDDYFLAAALQRNGNVQDSLGFLNAANSGTSVGFRPAATGLPQTGTVPGPTPAAVAPMANGAAPPAAGVDVQGLIQAALMGAGAQTPQQALQQWQDMTPEQRDALIASSPPLQQAGVNARMGFGAVQVPNAQQNVPGAPDGKMAVVGTGPAGPMVTTNSAPSPSVAGATAAAQGQPAAFTSAMNRAVPPPQQAYLAAQAQMPAPDLAAQRLRAMQPVFQAGAHKLAPGTLEAMTTTERGLLNSGLRASGLSPDDFESQYRRSRLQTGVSALAA